MADTICYVYENALYLNLTNRCESNCVFCLRKDSRGGIYADDLWLEKEPTVEEVLAEIQKYDIGKYREIVFCGYGEPLMRLDAVLQIAAELKKICTKPLRINTNGHANLLYKKNVPPLFKGLIDCVSVSLNALTAAEYNAVTRPSEGEATFYSMLEFTKGCSEYVPEVMMSIVRGTIAEEDIPLCEKLAHDCGAKLRIREYIKQK